MPITHTIVRSCKDQSNTTITDTDLVTGNYEVNLDDSLAGSSTNHQYAWAVTRANIKSLLFSSDSAITIYTNAPSGGAPQDTIPLVAGQALVWTLQTDTISRCPIAGNVTTIYVTNANSGAAAVRIRCVASQ